MELGILSDIHGNRVALAAVLADMPPVDGLVCAGDVVGYNPGTPTVSTRCGGTPMGSQRTFPGRPKKSRR